MDLWLSFIIKELTEEFKKQFTCLGENIKKYIIFPVPIEKEVTSINENGEEVTKSISCMFMASFLSNLINNLSEGIHRIKCKYGHEKRSETCKIEYHYCDCLLEYTNVKDDLIEYKYFCCNKSYQQRFDEKLKE